MKRFLVLVYCSFIWSFVRSIVRSILRKGGLVLFMACGVFGVITTDYRLVRFENWTATNAYCGAPGMVNFVLPVGASDVLFGVPAAMSLVVRYKSSVGTNWLTNTVDAAHDHISVSGSSFYSAADKSDQNIYWLVYGIGFGAVVYGFQAGRRIVTRVIGEDQGDAV